VTTTKSPTRACSFRQRGTQDCGTFGMVGRPPLAVDFPSHLRRGAIAGRPTWGPYYAGRALAAIVCNRNTPRDRAIIPAPPSLPLANQTMNLAPNANCRREFPCRLGRLMACRLFWRCASLDGKRRTAAAQSYPSRRSRSLSSRFRPADRLDIIGRAIAQAHEAW